MDILVLAKQVLRRWWIMVTVPVIAAIAAYLFTSNKPPLYKAVAQIATGYVTPDEFKLTEGQFNPRDADIKFSNLFTKLNSGQLFNLVSYRLILHDLENPDQSFRSPDPGTLQVSTDEWRVARTEFARKLAQMDPFVSSDSLYGTMRKYLDAYRYEFSYLRAGLGAQRVQNTDFIQVEFTSENPNLSAFAANAYCEEAIRFNNALKIEKTGESVEFLNQLVISKKRDLDEKMETLRVFKSNNGMLDAKDESQITLTQMRDLEVRRDLIQSKIHGLELTIKRLQADITSFSSQSPNENNQKIVDLRSRINNMNERYISGGSTNKALLDSLNGSREELRRVLNVANNQVVPNQSQTLFTSQSKLKDAEIELQVEKASLTQVDVKLRQLQYSVSGLTTRESQISAIQNEVDLASKEYLETVNKYNDARSRLLTSNSLRQAVIAAPPVNPLPTKQWLIVGLSGFTSLAICAFLLVLIEVLDLSVRTPEKFAWTVGLPLLGMVNRVDIKTFNVKNYFNQPSTDEKVETFKSLLRKLRYEVESLNAQIILFTSLKKREGKTFVILSVAYALSLIEKRVLIIDTNFKNNSLSKILNPTGEKYQTIDSKKARHLLTVGAGGKGEEPKTEQFDEAIYNLITPTSFNNVFIITNSGGSDSPAEIFSGKNFKNLVAAYSDSFDYIFMEGASVNDYSDTKELIEHVDRVVAVFAAGSSIKSIDKRSIAFLKSIKEKLGGAVLNSIEGKDLKL